MSHYTTVDDHTVPSEVPQREVHGRDWTLDNTFIYDKPLRWYIDHELGEHIWMTLVLHDPEGAQRIKEKKGPGA